MATIEDFNEDETRCCGVAVDRSYYAALFERNAENRFDRSTVLIAKRKDGKTILDFRCSSMNDSILLGIVRLSRDLHLLSVIAGSRVHCWLLSARRAVGPVSFEAEREEQVRGLCYATDLGWSLEKKKEVVVYFESSYHVEFTYS